MKIWDSVYVSSVTLTNKKTANLLYLRNNQNGVKNIELAKQLSPILQNTNLKIKVGKFWAKKSKNFLNWMKINSKASPPELKSRSRS